MKETLKGILLGAIFYHMFFGVLFIFLGIIFVTIPELFYGIERTQGQQDTLNFAYENIVKGTIAMFMYVMIEK